MVYKAVLREVLGDIDIIGNLYDFIRIVDPVRKKVYYNHKPGFDISTVDNDVCFEFWDDKVCANCTSARALMQNDTFVKVSFRNGKFYMSTSVPVVLQGDKAVVELIKDITTSGIIEFGNKGIIDMLKLAGSKSGLIIRNAISRALNESFIEERLPYDIFRAREQQSPLSIIYVSINNMKAINDLKGVAAGDHILEIFATLLKNYCRHDLDWVSRYSGNAFVLLLDGCGDIQAYRICKRVFAKIAKTQFDYNGKAVKVETSIGYCALTPEIANTEDFINKAASRPYEEPTVARDQTVAAAYKSLSGYLLTAREQEVARLLLYGKSNTDIAAKLYIGLPTVKKHISAIFDKMGVKSRAEFIATFRDQ